MAKTIRISDREEEYLMKILTKINKKLVEIDMSPMKDTELFHEIFRIIIMERTIELSEKGLINIS